MSQVFLRSCMRELIGVNRHFMEESKAVKNINSRISVIDSEGFRANVGIILCNDKRELFWGRRIGQDAWQFPQGGINEGESAEDAMFRELKEEVGLEAQHVELLGCTQKWLRYRLPKRYLRKNSMPLCIGQKQRWFMLKVRCAESDFCLDKFDKPEFDHWRWVDYWQPVREVVFFKRNVYNRALKELAPLLFPDGAPENNYRPRNRHPYRHRR